MLRIAFDRMNLIKGDTLQAHRPRRDRAASFARSEPT